ncbi:MULTISPECIES: hypothetical protein [unclassified Saccharibacter]|uniref:hypothetical protein n=1 Tax=unclassified Saccharibacter TaxID=2648722 RepID=UPI00132B615D|nr:MULTISPECIES: hypothetical protein [unclassified Saccharibacter]MXV35938.1 hypothetical protein [Saccharibacter sp. EH611]MXV58372.1 hypothetical protein [Saccharibacter sp. EH70]MXV65828.1 hypothetical protein [Saccharibacter sp. EH60]
MMSDLAALKERIAHTHLLLDLIEQRDVLTPEEVEERLVLKERLRHQQRALEEIR